MKKEESFVFFSSARKKTMVGFLPIATSQVRGCGHLISRLRGQGSGHLGEAAEQVQWEMDCPHPGWPSVYPDHCLTRKAPLAWDGVCARLGVGDMLSD